MGKLGFIERAAASLWRLTGRLAGGRRWYLQAPIYLLGGLVTAATFLGLTALTLAAVTFGITAALLLGAVALGIALPFVMLFGLFSGGSGGAPAGAAGQAGPVAPPPPDLVPHAQYQGGEYVAAGIDLHTGVFATVPAGERGVVRDTREGAMRENQYLVKFFSGAELWCQESHLVPG